MKNYLINLLFSLLGSPSHRIYNVQYLFGATTFNHEARKKRWERALIRMWKDKDLLDFLYYQAEADKENVFQGKVSRDLSRGARIRTLFLVFSARRAYQLSLKNKRKDGEGKGEVDKDLKEATRVYKDLTDVDKDA